MADFDRCLLCVANHHLLAFELSQPRWPQGVPCFRLTLQAEKTARWPHQQTHNSISALCEAACSPIFPLVRLCPSCPHSGGFRTARVISLGSSARIGPYQEQGGR
ncbi:hypothetical protein AV530_015000 [Patagioenas fasciata monilis]|uniref:Uncharacterized protein n=1 Tax=Patagioenas fasciata monilis TaxID=372326 RepID=A0A1V4K0U0_PATFA|nr:hypothetical protein AV530_015000 [Patagioenas fasciata monilis]